MPREFDLRKGLHLKLLPLTAAEFRIAVIRRGLSMQEVVEEFCQRTVMGDRYCEELMNSLVDRKRLKIVSQMTGTDAESIFSAIEIDDMAQKVRRGQSKLDEDDDDT